MGVGVGVAVGPYRPHQAAARQVPLLPAAIGVQGAGAKAQRCQRQAMPVPVPPPHPTRAAWACSSPRPPIDRRQRPHSCPLAATLLHPPPNLPLHPPRRRLTRLHTGISISIISMRPCPSRSWQQDTRTATAMGMGMQGPCRRRLPPLTAPPLAPGVLRATRRTSLPPLSPPLAPGPLQTWPGRQCWP